MVRQRFILSAAVKVNILTSTDGRRQHDLISLNNPFLLTNGHPSVLRLAQIMLAGIKCRRGPEPPSLGKVKLGGLLNSVVAGIYGPRTNGANRPEGPGGSPGYSGTSHQEGV